MSRTATERRRADLAAIHIAGKQLFGDVSSNGIGREDYEDWLEQQTGKRSSGDLTTPERIELIRKLRKQGLLRERERGGRGPDRPTPAQRGKIGALARELGWEKGLDDPRLRAFVQRTAKVSTPKFLSRQKASKIILGLEAWLRQTGKE